MAATVLSPTAAKLRVAIAGAGLGGLTVARILARSARSDLIAVTVFERDATSTSRDQGTCLDLDKGSQKVVANAGLTGEKLAAISRAGSDCLSLLNGVNKAEIVSTRMPKLLKRFTTPEPEVNRRELRDALLEGMTVQWGMGVKSVRVLEDGSLLLIGLDGKLIASEHKSSNDSQDSARTGDCFDVVIGADGGRSKLRSLVFDEELGQNYYSGFTVLQGVIPDFARLCPELDELSHAGTVSAIGPKVGEEPNCNVTVQRFGSCNKDQRAACYVIQKIERGSLNYLLDDPESMDAAVRKLIDEKLERGKWATEFRHAVQQAESFVIREFVQHPMNPVLREDDQRVSGLILIGDALHGMTSYGGYGGNLALKDAYDVAKALESLSVKSEKVNVEGLDGVVAKLYAGMLGRSLEPAQETAALTESLHSGKVISTDTYDWSAQGGLLGKTIHGLLRWMRS